jgi:hypothetical protein
MAIRLSTGLRVAMLQSSGLYAVMNNGIIKIYTGSQPASADDAASGTLLATSNSFTIGFVHTAAMSKIACLLPILCSVQHSGTAGWFRWYGDPSDSGGASTTKARVDGSIPENLKLSSVNITGSSLLTIDQFELIFPNEA